MQVGRDTNKVPSKLRLVRYTEDYISSWCLLRNTKYSAVRTVIVMSPPDLTPLLLPSSSQATLQSTPQFPFLSLLHSIFTLNFHRKTCKSTTSTPFINWNFPYLYNFIRIFFLFIQKGVKRNNKSRQS
jgi:hypothetical protein